MHWGTFQLTAEDVIDPLIDLENAKRKININDEDFTTMAIGETLYLQKSNP